MFKNSFFKLNKNRKFNYKPRYLKDKNEEINYSFDSRIRGSRDSIVSNSRSSFWNHERIKKRINENRSFNRLFIVILLLLSFIFFYIIDFDFSIFVKH